MSNKKEESPKLTGEMHLTDLSFEKKREYFPTSITLIKDILETWVDVEGVPTHTGYTCMDDVDSNTVNIHLYMFPEYRTAPIVIEMIKNFKQVAAKYMHSVNKSIMISSCTYDDVNIKGLFDAMGFNTEAIWLGSINFKGD